MRSLTYYPKLMPSLRNNEEDIIYDRFGAPRLRILSNGRIANWNGHYLGFLRNDRLVYSQAGIHIGWYENGILRDLNGNTVGFGLSPTDTPRPWLPFKQFLPMRGILEIPPIKPLPSMPSLRPFKSFAWSDIDIQGLFEG